MYKFPNLSPSQLMAVELQALGAFQAHHNRLVEAERAAELRVAEDQARAEEIIAQAKIEREKQMAAEDRARREEARNTLESELKRKFMALDGSTEFGWSVVKDDVIADYWRSRMQSQSDFEARERAAYPPM